MLNPTEVLSLARVYAGHTGLALSSVAKRALGPRNSKALTRIERGLGVSTLTLERLTLWLLTNWPADAVWPNEVPGAPIVTVTHPLKRYARVAADEVPHACRPQETADN